MDLGLSLSLGVWVVFLCPSPRERLRTLFDGRVEMGIFYLPYRRSRVWQSDLKSR